MSPESPSNKSDKMGENEKSLSCSEENLLIANTTNGEKSLITPTLCSVFLLVQPQTVKC